MFNNTPVQMPMYQSTFVFLLVGLAFQVVELLLWQARAPALIPNALTDMVIFLALFAVLIVMRSSKHIEVIAGWIFLGASLEVLRHIAVNHEYYVANDMPFEPFIGVKILAFLVPLFCPRKRWAGYGTLLAAAVFPLALYQTFDYASRVKLGIQEPWVTVAFVAASAIIYKMFLKIVEVRQGVRALRMANFIVGVQHLVNTPSQIIATATALIEMDFPAAKPLTDKIEAAFERIRKVNSALAMTDANIQWDVLDLPLSADELELKIKKLGFI